VHNNSAEDDKAKIAEHVMKDSPERWGTNVENIIKKINEVFEDGKKYKAGNGNAIYVKRKSRSETWILIHNKSDNINKGTFIKRTGQEADPSSVDSYIKKFLDRNS
jgi:putative heme iron utilization protein